MSKGEASGTVGRGSDGRGADIVGEEYLLLGSSDMGSVIQKIEVRKPDMILNTLEGERTPPSVGRPLIVADRGWRALGHG